MEESVSPPNNNMFCSSPDPIMDMDLDELFVEGCWLGTNDGSELLNPSFSSNALFDPSFIWDILEENKGESSGSSSQKDIQEERQRSSLSENLSITQSQVQNSSQCLGETMINAVGCSSQAENHLVESLELSRKWWIGPSNGLTMSVMDRLVKALEYFKGCTRDREVLLQIWVPVNRGGRRVLSTSDQPFSLDLNCPRLASYRDISVNYQFPADEDSKEVAGMPGRVFLGKVPEWSPDVRFLKMEEYARVGHAQQYDVRGTLAVPVLEQGSSSCLGVIEVVTTAQKIDYRLELESVCKALEAVNLRGSEVANTQNVKIRNCSYQVALPEILEVLRSACETHRLPLAQTWVSCVQQGKEGCRHSDKNLVNCVSTVDSACYIAEPCIRGFHEACSEHHLLKGQGVVGRAFMTNQPCFSSDVTSFSKTEYPLSHYARMFRFCGAVAIRLRSIYTGTVDFVLEFFLPMDCRDPEEQKKLLNSLSIIIRKICFSLRILTDKEFQEETVTPVGETVVPSEGGRLSRQEMPEVEYSENSSHEVSYRIASHMETQESDNIAPLFSMEKPTEVIAENALDLRQHQHNSTSRLSVAFSHAYSNSGQDGILNVGKTGEKGRIKADKTITLEMLRQYFAGSLKDAAKSIGVCPTTLKRICRLHGIPRWPSRKIKKVGHSLQKIQGVIDSVQDASGGFQIKSFYSNFPELASPDLSGTSPTSASKARGNSKSLNSRLNESRSLSPEAAASKSPSSSCSQSSSSSQCCSSGTQPHNHALTVSGQENPVMRDNPGDTVLKRARSDAELLASSDEVPKLLPRSQSHKSLVMHPKSERVPTLPKNDSWSYPEGNSTQRVKVAYGEEKVRFRMLNTWGYQDLLQEILKRFGIDDKNGFHLKYLDDDSEWVLLTCDDDLEECLDVCQSTRSHTIKLSLHQSPQQHLGSSLGKVASCDYCSCQN